MFDVLADSIIRVRLNEGSATLTLPGVYAALAADAVDAFPALRPHQRHAWHMFLAQLGALALHRGGIAEPPGDAAAWADLLRALTPGEEETAWALVVEDVSRPAFLQPPAPEGDLAAYKRGFDTPDALDVLIASKNFDVKTAVAGQAAPDDWLFALVSLQTMEGFLGAGNYGIARMNGGFSARPCLGLAPPGGFGAQVMRDIRAMIAMRPSLLGRAYAIYPEEDGLALLWLAPWDGTEALSLRRIDPWFIEICRRVRLVAVPGGGLRALGAPTKSARLDARALNGVTGDFWAPVNAAEGKAFSLDARGFSTRVLTKLLFGEGGKADFDLPPAMTPQPGEDDMLLVARGVTRGQGKTEGLHERIIPFGRKAARKLGSPEGRAALGAIAEAQQKEAQQIARALGLGGAVTACGGAEPGKEDYAFAQPFLARLDTVAEAHFFAALQDRFTEDAAAAARARIGWLTELVRAADALLDEAVETIPCAAINRPRARVYARRAYGAALWGPKSLLTNDKAAIRGTAPQGEETADAG